MPPRKKSGSRVKAQARKLLSQNRQTPRHNSKAAFPTSLAAPPDAMTEVARRQSAARRVYEMLDLRNLIYAYLDRRTLLGMMALERNGIASISDILYKRSNIAELKNFSRPSERRAIYRQSVRILDISPPLDHKQKRSIFDEPYYFPTFFKPRPLLAKIASWRERFPRLHTIANEFPSDDRDDAYIVRLRDDQIFVDLRTIIEFPNAEHPTVPVPSRSVLPPTPVYDGINLTYTIGVRVHNAYARYPSRIVDSLDGRFAIAKKWCEFFKLTPDLDRRITSLGPSVKLGDNLGEAIATMIQRKADGCELWASYALSSRSLSLDDLRDAFPILGPGLRKLVLETPIFERATELRDLTSLLDDALPQLQNLDITFRLGKEMMPSHHAEDGPFLADFEQPKPGFLNLRKLRLSFEPAMQQDPRVIARYFSPLGSEDCLYSVTMLRDEYAKAFNSMVRQASL